MTRVLSRRQLWLAAIALAAAACGTGGAPKVPLSLAAVDSSPKAIEAAHSLLGPAAKAALDSGNALYRRKAFPEALAAYRHASDLAPQHSAPLFGIYMVARATSNSVLADSAMSGIRARNGPLPSIESSSPHSMTDSSLKALRARMKKGSKAS